MVIAGYAIAKGRQPLINTLDNHLIRQAVSQMLKLWTIPKHRENTCKKLMMNCVFLDI
jgi:hypothetical protein